MSKAIESTYNEDVDPAKTYERKVSPNVNFYQSVRASKAEGTRKHVRDEVLLPHTGDAYFVKAGQVIRFEQRPSLHNHRTQIIDVHFVTPNLEQWGDHLNTSAVNGLNQRLYSAVWSQSGFMEKMVTLVEDEFPYEKLQDESWSHIFFAAHCCPEWLNMCYGKEGNVNSCQENFIHAFGRIPAIANIENIVERRAVIKQFADRNDINMFQPNKFSQDEQGITRCMLAPSPGVEDGVGCEFYAEKDQYIVVSNCPYADQALPYPEAKPNPVYVSIFDTGIKPEVGHLGDIGGWEEDIYARIATKDNSIK
ncbi:DUF1989 domain-containing protein [Agarivorans aestuarii]|uniref:DUF1989 domain-containing protein n=1 Tax=Agarivorans aestuarii TaxID=1563703 RepID=A0ABU7G4F4_9ALTE|nr:MULTISPECIES: DUF1989 domain-containing protein [Agarivorans]MEE1674132.1 DUF1989 domain-containing protein [Agarivorans aestuarii]